MCVLRSPQDRDLSSSSPACSLMAHSISCNHFVTGRAESHIGTFPMEGLWSRLSGLGDGWRVEFLASSAWQPSCSGKMWKSMSLSFPKCNGFSSSHCGMRLDAAGSRLGMQDEEQGAAVYPTCCRPSAFSAPPQPPPAW